ncbi:uncharacterized protein LOC113383024 [Ctenocephalides felis]|uniref:uncharacterized protein LOC113383024 n=1 Tax=Ctenocephalides felis TaxID=7515 RepID=UPI000E6E3E4F|nr:uncharacterized protein LOC113383024 [Ctenocephalides felis]
MLIMEIKRQKCRRVPEDFANGQNISNGNDDAAKESMLEQDPQKNVSDEDAFRCPKRVDVPSPSSHCEGLMLIMEIKRQKCHRVPEDFATGQNISSGNDDAAKESLLSKTTKELLAMMTTYCPKMPQLMLSKYANHVLRATIKIPLMSTTHLPLPKNAITDDGA